MSQESDEVALRESIGAIAKSLATALPANLCKSIGRYLQTTYELVNYDWGDQHQEKYYAANSAFFAALNDLSKPSAQPASQYVNVSYGPAIENIDETQMRCRFDVLRFFLAESDRDLHRIAAAVGIDRLASVVVREDYRTMPLDSLGMAAHLFWSAAENPKRIMNEAEARRRRQRADALVQAGIVKTLNAKERHQSLDRVAFDYFRAHPTATNPGAAQYFLDLANRMGWKGFSRSTVKSVTRAIAGIKKRAVASLAEASKPN